MCEWKESSFIPTLRSEDLANILTECFSLHQGDSIQGEHPVEMLARFSNLKVSIRELSFPFMQEPTEKQPLMDVSPHW